MNEDRLCVLCPRSIFRRRQNHILSASLLQTHPAHVSYIQANAIRQVVFNNTQSVCHRCWQRVSEEPEQPSAPDDGQETPPPVPLIEDNVQAANARTNNNEHFVPSYKRAPNTSNHCVFSDCVRDSRRRIAKTIKVYMLTVHKLYIPQHARAGSLHFWVGRTVDEFNSIISQTPSLQGHRDARTILGIYLAKLRTGESNERLASLFKMSRRTLERKLVIARKCLDDEYVPQHLGLDHITRNEALQKILLIPKSLFGDEANTKLVLICDGTYIYIQKSANFLFQRLSYSLHKFDNLLKPFLITTSDGYIIDVLGPYAATTSDATILNSILNDEEHPLHVFLAPNDVFILDRGFRDAIENLEPYGYEGRMPPTKANGATQLTTVQANESRKITICRWVIEVVNGRFKRDYKLLRQDYFNRALPHMFVDFKVCAALINHFHVVLNDNEQAPSILNKIQEREHMPNILMRYVVSHSLNRQRVPFRRMEDSNIDFPSLTKEQIILFALGTYHIKLAKSYCAEHLRDGVYSIELYRDGQLHDLNEFNIQQRNVYLMRIRIQSRHVRARQYYGYILIDRDQTGIDAIIQYYCSCLTGSRTLGSCAHILSVVWYMSLARHEGFNPPAQFLDEIIIDCE